MSTIVEMVGTNELRPNPYNPNRVSPDMMEKLERNVLHTWNTHGTMPPVVTRTLPNQPGYEIIDGYHRWTIFKENSLPEIPTLNLGEVSLAEAQRLCLTLNYIKGNPDPRAYISVVEEMMMEAGWGVEETALYLPEGPDALADMMALLGDGDPTLELSPGDEDIDSMFPPPEAGENPDAKGRGSMVEVVFAIPLNVARRLEEIRSDLYDMLDDNRSKDPPDVDGTLIRLTCAMFRSTISKREDVFQTLMTQASKGTGITVSVKETRK